MYKRIICQNGFNTPTERKEIVNPNQFNFLIFIASNDQAIVRMVDLINKRTTFLQFDDFLEAQIFINDFREGVKNVLVKKEDITEQTETITIKRGA